jgi:hypothetical protein
MKPSLSIFAYINIVKIKGVYPRSRFLVGPTSTYACIAQAQILILMLSISTCATSIVVARTSAEVVVGADSRGTFDDGKTVTVRNVCKIHEHAGIFYAIAGIEVDPITGFNSASLVANEIDKVRIMSTLVPAIEQVIKVRLTHELEWQRKERPNLYRRTVENNNIALSIVIAGIENETPVFYARAFIADGTILREDHPSGEFTVWMGKADAIQRFIAQPNRPVFSTSVETVRALIQLEIDSGEPSVGSPVDIVRLTKGSATWIQKKPECPDVQLQATPAKPRQGFPLPDSRPPIGTIMVALIVGAALLYFFIRRR